MVDINNNAEVQAMSESCQILCDTLDHIEKFVIPGESVLNLDSIAEDYILSKGGIPAFKGYNNFPSTLCISIDDEVVHGIPQNIFLEEGQIVSIDCGVLKNDYYSDSARTFPVGKISNEKQKLLEVTKKALEIGIEKAVPGNKVFDISDSIQKFVESNGFSVVRELVGHGIGKQLHLEPQIPNFSVPRTFSLDTVLVEGMCLAIEPMVNLGKKDIYTMEDGWTVKTKDGSPSAHFEHSVLITNFQPRILTKN
jgi:methionyl aminopeptidase